LFFISQTSNIVCKNVAKVVLLLFVLAGCGQETPTEVIFCWDIVFLQLDSYVKCYNSKIKLYKIERWFSRNNVFFLCWSVLSYRCTQWKVPGCSFHEGHGKCELSRALLICRECVVIISKFSRKIRVDITLLQTTMYKSYLFCANYALFVLSTLVERATHSDVAWCISAIFGRRFQCVAHDDSIMWPCNQATRGKLQLGKFRKRSALSLDSLVTALPGTCWLLQLLRGMFLLWAFCLLYHLGTPFIFQIQLLFFYLFPSAVRPTEG